MTQYIDKSTLVAEIEKAIDEPAPSHDQQCPWEDGYYCGLSKAENILDTLEVKEVDLKKEFYDFLDTLIGKDNGHLSEDELFRIAEYFYELGLKTQKGEE